MWESIWNCVSQAICLKLPIGWDELGVIATVLAVIVALRANAEARKQLKSALQIQEQSKNVALFEQRVQVADSIRNDELPSETAMTLLFSVRAFELYNGLRRAHMEHQRAVADEDTYFSCHTESDGAGGQVNPVKEQIKKYEQRMSQLNCPETVDNEYQKFCDQHEVHLSDPETNKSQTYNHAEIRKRKQSALEKMGVHKIVLLDQIEKEIAVSIAPVG